MFQQRALMLPAAALASLILLVATLSAAGDISGNWHFVLQTPGGEREADASFQVDGGQVTGKFADTEVKGSFKDGALDLAFPFNSAEAGGGTMNIKGALASGELSGTWEFAGYSGTFAAKHPQ